MRRLFILAIILLVGGLVAGDAYSIAFDDVVCLPQSDNTRACPSGVVGFSYEVRIVVRGGCGENVFSKPSGNLPSGLALSKDGIISGTPSSAGTSSFWVEVTSCEPAETAVRAFSILIQEPPPAPEPPPEPAPEPSPEPSPEPPGEPVDPLVFFTNSLATAHVGKAYRQRLVVQGGTPPYVWRVIGLPQRLHLRGGVLTGHPKRAGRYVFTVSVIDAAGLQASDKLLLLVRR